MHSHWDSCFTHTTWLWSFGGWITPTRCSLWSLTQTSCPVDPRDRYLPSALGVLRSQCPWDPAIRTTAFSSGIRRWVSRPHHPFLSMAGCINEGINNKKRFHACDDDLTVGLIWHHLVTQRDNDRVIFFSFTTVCVCSKLPRYIGRFLVRKVENKKKQKRTSRLSLLNEKVQQARHAHLTRYPINPDPMYLDRS